MTIRFFFVARPGFEPRQTEPKSVVLPLYYRAVSVMKAPCNGTANIGGWFNCCKQFLHFTVTGKETGDAKGSSDPDAAIIRGEWASPTGELGCVFVKKPNILPAIS